MSLPPHLQLPMRVCQTCGDEGYSNLLVHCVQCQITAVHRYCVDGPPKVDDDEVIWSCEECVPRKVNPPPRCRKSERVNPKVVREAQRRKARRGWRNNLSLLEVEKSKPVDQRENKAGGDAFEVNENINNIFKRKQINSELNGTGSKNGGSALDSPVKNMKKILESNGDKKKGSEPSLVVQQMTGNFKVCSVDEDLQATLENKLGSQLSEKEDKGLEISSKADERGDEGSIGETHLSPQEELKGSAELSDTVKHGTSDNLKDTNLGSQLSEKEDNSLEISSKADERGDEGSIGETHLSPQEELQGSTGPSDSVKHGTSNNLKDTKAISASSESGDKKINVYEIQTANKKRRLVIAMEYSDSDEESIGEKPDSIADVGGSLFHKSESVVSTQPCVATSDSPIATRASSLEFQNSAIPQFSSVVVNNYIPAQPIYNAVWRGRCSFIWKLSPICFALEANLSSKAHAKVHGAASALPDILAFEVEKKQYAWPKNFEMSPPTADDIGLYFFPVGESDERWYEYLLDLMIDCDLVLKCCINNLELLVFCSQVLPQGERRFRSKYYLWGVFKRRQEISMTTSAQPCIPNTMSNNKDFHRNCSTHPSSPSSIENFSVVNSSKSHVPHYTLNHVVESPQSITLKKHPKLASNEQGQVSQLEANDNFAPAWGNGHLNPQRTSNHQAYGRESFVESPPSITLKHPKLASNEQGYITQLEANDKNGPARSDDRQYPLSTSDPRAYGRSSFVDSPPITTLKHPKLDSNDQGCVSQLEANNKCVPARGNDRQNFRRTSNSRAYGSCREVKSVFREQRQKFYNRANDTGRRKHVNSYKGSSDRKSSYSHRSYRSGKY